MLFYDKRFSQVGAKLVKLEFHDQRKGLDKKKFQDDLKHRQRFTELLISLIPFLSPELHFVVKLQNFAKHIY